MRAILATLGGALARSMDCYKQRDRVKHGYFEVNMSQAREPDDQNLGRTLISFNFPQGRLRQRGLSRVEDTQLTWRELNDSLVSRRFAVSSLQQAKPTRRYANGNPIYDEIDTLKGQMNKRFDEQI